MKMKYIVRIWIDLKITANSEKEARELAKTTPITVKETFPVEYYDSQVGEIWERDPEDNL